MKRSARRIIFKVLGLLIAGAAVNVAVAWGLAVSCEQFSDLRAVWHSDEFITRHQYWVERRPTGFEVPVWNWTREGVGARSVFLWNGGRINEDTSVLGEDGQLIIAGWPIQTLHGCRWKQATYRDQGQTVELDRNDGLMGPDTTTPLPLRPLWPGFAVNTLFYAGVLWALFAFPGALRRMIRRRRGLCAACAYPIGTSEVCTECGAPHSAVAGGGGG